MKISEIETDGYERVIHGVDEAIGLNAFIAVHSTRLGPACGGLRLLPYPNEAQALEDVKRLAIAMTYKSAVANTGLGGGKAVVIAKPEAKSEALLRGIGKLIDTLGGAYITAEDMNITVADLEVIREETRWVAGLSRESGSSGDPSPYTALGCFLAMKACVKHLLGNDDLHGLKVAVQGVGAVGSRLAELCRSDGASLAVCDIDLSKAQAFAKIHDCEVIPRSEDFLSYPCDILSPCARGELLGPDTIALLDCRLIVGSANNQLLHPEDAERIRARHILYAPDYVVNAGGIINVGCEFLPGGYNEEEALRRVHHIREAMELILEIRERDGISTNAAARFLAEERLSADAPDKKT